VFVFFTASILRKLKPGLKNGLKNSYLLIGFLFDFFIFRPMKIVEKHPENLPALVTEKAAENQSFRNFIHALPSKQIDFTLDVIIPEVEKNIDCTQCGNCCRHLQPGLSGTEISTLATKKNMSDEDFKNQFTAQEKGTMIQYMTARPCVFLDHKICSIYESRPHSCKDFPYLDESRIKMYWKRVMEYYKICPIVFNTVELLKKEVGFGVDGK
jgi:Fe-S-cluster containining protein